METMERTKIQVETKVNVPVEKVWACFTEPRHIVMWNHASDDWHTTSAENDSRAGGRFNFRMEAKDGSFGFNFSGVNTKVEPYRILEYTLDDTRKVKVTFDSVNEVTHVVQVFETESTHSIEMQRSGWQAILNNFKKYAEDRGKFNKLHFEVLIDTKPDVVYRVMLDSQHYSEWTAAFNPHSRYEGAWEKGASIRFIGVGEDGKKGGMISRIRENIPNKFVSIKHLGIFDGDKDITSGPEVDAWAGGHEDYSFLELEGKTLVSVDLDVNDEYEGYFDETWPNALEKLKEICEKS